jgi:hypothetical protein
VAGRPRVGGLASDTVRHNQVDSFCAVKFKQAIDQSVMIASRPGLYPCETVSRRELAALTETRSTTR